MSTVLILKDLLKHKVRKEIIKNNKKLNHKAYTKSLSWGQKIPFLMKYHKKKLIFLLVLGIVTWNYSLHKSTWLIIRLILLVPERVIPSQNPLRPIPDPAPFLTNSFLTKPNKNPTIIINTIQTH